MNVSLSEMVQNYLIYNPQNFILLKYSENLEKFLNTAHHCIHKVRFKLYNGKRKLDINLIPEPADFTGPELI